MRNRHQSQYIVCKDRYLAPKPDNFYCYVLKAYHKIFYIKIFTVDFVSITKTKQVDHNQKFLQQVVWTGSSQHDRASKLHI